MTQPLPPQSGIISEQTSSPIGGAGFESEGITPSTAPVKPPKANEFKKNFLSVFGHGIGKISLIAIGLVVCGGIALGIRGLSSSDKAANTKQASAPMDVPAAPIPQVSNDPISQKEAQRRAQRGALEADKALNDGKTYQPGFDTNVVNDQALPLNKTSSPPVPPVNVTVPIGQNTAQTNNAQQQVEQKATQEEKEASTTQEKYRTDIQKEVLKQVDTLFSDSKGSLNNLGSYSRVNYFPGNAKSNASSGTPGTQTSTTNDANGSTPKNHKVLIKTGMTLFATLDSEVNTDDGGDVLATLHGGQWEGAKIIGKIEQAPDNIRLRFTTLAPQDERPTMKINAVALREEDAKQGVADDINHHILSRYTALAVASILTGFGQAAQINPGTTQILPNGTVVTSTPDVTSRRVAGMALGQVGINAGAEIHRGFNQKPTYATPAQRGIGIYFLEDVQDKTK